MKRGGGGGHLLSPSPLPPGHPSKKFGAVVVVTVWAGFWRGGGGVATFTSLPPYLQVLIQQDVSVGPTDCPNDVYYMNISYYPGNRTRLPRSSNLSLQAITLNNLIRVMHFP